MQQEQQNKQTGKTKRKEKQKIIEVTK